MTPREQEEYRALRDTIRERGTTRAWLFLIGLVLWAGLTVAVGALAALPVATLLPLLILAAVFETIFSMHTGVERIGRYIQVYYEEDAGSSTDLDRKWEQAAMAYAGAFPRSGVDPLFTLFFVAATILNFVPVLLAEPVALEVSSVGTVHVLFILRLFVARRVTGRQRAVDLERFRQMKTAGRSETSG
jgi:hypothetical protein